MEFECHFHAFLLVEIILRAPAKIKIVQRSTPVTFQNEFSPTRYPKKIKASYTIAYKRAVLGLLANYQLSTVAKYLRVPRRTLQDWAQNFHAIFAYDGNQIGRLLTLPGRPEYFPGPDGLVAFMVDMRARERALTCTHIINWIAWPWTPLPGALRAKNVTIESRSLLLIHRNDLLDVRDKFAGDFKEEYSSYAKEAIYNVDETAMYYEMPPRVIWAIRGGDAKISAGEKQSHRLTAVLTARADGTKLPILFVIRGSPGGTIETREFPTFPQDHLYAVQEKAWMDGRVWSLYLRRLLGQVVDEPSVVIVDNFDAHVNEESFKIVQEELGSHLCALPPNATGRGISKVTEFDVLSARVAVHQLDLKELRTLVYQQGEMIESLRTMYLDLARDHHRLEAHYFALESPSVLYPVAQSQETGFQ
ncbi:Aste57867_19905 [Aphanomyces stellatus]|uniref:Aste57867_19905 protein n=1 Tax=Aphanomyces stellatus TaxID=120398 RepID=A0A485LIC5_9STRA|nr:hypothetical protein As57867_019839 [Aphanomyces stellatus]VFT96603.1 Aste57867_19905 [Aphanomyces stellatus]